MASGSYEPHKQAETQRSEVLTGGDVTYQYGCACLVQTINHPLKARNKACTSIPCHLNCCGIYVPACMYGQKGHSQPISAMANVQGRQTLPRMHPGFSCPAEA